jgi:hypothetical protein
MAHRLLQHYLDGKTAEDDYEENVPFKDMEGLAANAERDLY